MSETPYTALQIRALRWLNEMPSNRARWMRDGKEAFGPPELWDTMEISGSERSIRIKTDDWKAIRDLIIGCPNTTKIYGLNEGGRAAIAKATTPRGE